MLMSDNDNLKNINDSTLNQISDKIISLANAGRNKRYRIEKISGCSSLNMRLLSLGFIPGEYIKVIDQYGKGPLTAYVKGNKVALGRGVAGKIFISEVD